MKSGIIYFRVKENISTLDSIATGILSDLSCLTADEGFFNLQSQSDQTKLLVNKIAFAKSLHNDLSSSFKLDKKGLSTDVIHTSLNAISDLMMNTIAISAGPTTISPVEKKLLSRLQEFETIITGYIALGVYKKITDLLLDETLPLDEDIFYWDDVESSGYGIPFLYLQSIPYNIVQSIKSLYKDGRQTVNFNTSSDENENIQNKLITYIKHWFKFLKTQFTQIHQLLPWKSTSPKLLLTSKRIKLTPDFFLSPLDVLKSQIALNKQKITELRNSKANILGLLASSQLFKNKLNPKISDNTFDENEWQLQIQNGISLMNDALFSGKFINENIKSSHITVNNADSLTYLQNIISYWIPHQSRIQLQTQSKHGKPSIVFRYWPLLIVSGVSLYIAVKKGITNYDAIINWFKLNCIDTIIGFWQNWIIQPVTKILSTIRHDDTSRIALISKKSLEADLKSLERMVIDYVTDRTTNQTISSENPNQIVQIQKDVQDGDLTTLMKPYESQLKNPVISLLKGTLVRSLLIQIQKTKVDVDVAISGIDQLLKSQELVFGIVAILPSGLFTLWSGKRFYEIVFKGRSIKGSGQKKQHVLRTLGRIQRILNRSTQDTNTNELSFKDEGLLLCEVNLLRNASQQVIPKNLFRDWLEDLQDLEDQNLGVKSRLRTIDRIWNVYRSSF